MAQGAEVCVTVTLLDALVLARSAFHHSMNYRSVMLFGTTTRVEDDDEKQRASMALLEHIVPGRSAHARAPSAEELRAVLMVRVPIAEGSAKVRNRAARSTSPKTWRSRSGPATFPCRSSPAPRLPTAASPRRGGSRRTSRVPPRGAARTHAFVLVMTDDLLESVGHVVGVRRPIVAWWRRGGFDSSSSWPLSLVWSLVNVSFADLGVRPDLVSRLTARGLTSPFPIQRATLPDALAGRDVCGRAPTGSGKTLAFGLAVVSRSGGSKPGLPGALVLVPTRELASQVQREISLLSGHGSSPRDRRLRWDGIPGHPPSPGPGGGRRRGLSRSSRGPGRPRRHRPGAVRTVVVDEADRMADMGFLPVVRRLLDRTAPDRQVMLFSATMGPEVETLVKRYQTDPARHDVANDEPCDSDVSHLFWSVPRHDRVSVTVALVGEHGRALVFCRTRRGADRVTVQLNAGGVKALAIHGGKTQGQRERALAAFADGRARALVATDVAARGIHVEDLPCVVHYDPPADDTDYLHRSGRTGRAGKTGIVVSLVADEQLSANKVLQRSLGFETVIHARGPSKSLGRGSGVRKRQLRSHTRTASETVADQRPRHTIVVPRVDTSTPRPTSRTQRPRRTGTREPRRRSAADTRGDRAVLRRQEGLRVPVQARRRRRLRPCQQHPGTRSRCPAAGPAGEVRDDRRAQRRRGLQRDGDLNGTGLPVEASGK